ncbi:hypothetical protein DH2020_019138 [Rehmannia glutinosa]|uniref:Homeobox domain-containing protein n=1 Tax=Rehmannia glutinosa TaxID=99300 RepID=A0ABR0WMT2_REHGL
MAKRFAKYQIDALMAAFEESEHLTKQKKMELCISTGLDVEQIGSWFNRKRAHKRAKKSVGVLQRTNGLLEQALQEIEKKKDELRKEIRESKRREAEIGAENLRLREQLGMVGGDSYFDPILSHLKSSTVFCDIPYLDGE